MSLYMLTEITNIMKSRLNYSFVLFCWLVLIFNVKADPKKNKSCENNCFSSSILSAVPDDNGCVNYELEVSYSGKCASDLSHYTVAIPDCASLSAVSNSEGWKQELNITDPKTGLSGFKIDDIPNFGESCGFTSFKVNFTLCSSCNDCSTELNCWSPIVAYKAGSCIFYDTLNVSCNPPIEATVQKKDLSCYASNDGELNVIVTEGTEPYSFIWSNGDTTQMISNLVAGEYSVQIIDGAGEELILEEVVAQPQEIVAAATIQNEDCGGMYNGSITLTVEGGVGGFTYLWSNGSAANSLDSLAAGIYTVQITDSSGCFINVSYEVLSTSNLVIQSNVTHASCIRNNGAIDITMSGGSGEYSYNWSNGESSEDISNLEPGSYTVTVSDSNGCQTSASYNINIINTLTIMASVTKTGCLEDNSGAIDITVSGGTQPYSFLWSNGDTTEDLTQLDAGTYSVTVTDAEGCIRSLSFLISSEKIAVSVDVNKPKCYGDTDGSITVTPQSGIAPYSYVWSNGEITSEIGDLGVGFYSVTITDAIGCSATYGYFLNQPAQLTGSYEISSSCGNEGSYAIDLTISGGTSPYVYEWSTGEKSEDLDGLSSGVYSVLVIDNNQCTYTNEIIIDADPVVLSCLIEEPKEDIICNTTGNILNAIVEGGDSYHWSVVSSDGSWVITSGENTPQITYTAGNKDISATFNLMIEKEDCQESCTITLTGCPTPDCGEEEKIESTNSSVVAYPNPFIDYLNIELKIENDTYVTIAVFNQSGDLVSKVFDGNLYAGEQYSFKVDSQDWQKGIYYYKINSNEINIIERLVLLK